MLHGKKPAFYKHRHFTAGCTTLLESSLKQFASSSSSLRGRKLGHGLGSLGHSVLRQFSRKHQSDRCLNFSARKCCLLVVRRQFAGFCCDALKDVVDERVHDRHSLLRDTGIGVNLFQHLVNVRRVTLGTLLGLLHGGGCLFRCLFGGFL